MMVYKITRHIYDGESHKIHDFLRKTEKFQKKFYKIEFDINAEGYRNLVIHAIGISRDLIYEIFWTMNAECIYTEKRTVEEEISDRKKEDQWILPLWGWVPKLADDKKMWFSNLCDSPENQKCYLPILSYEDFALVDYIEEK